MKINIKELAVFSILGTVMFISKIFMELLPNVHLLGVLTITYTVVYRKKAIYPIAVYILLNGIYCGFSLWWVPYLYLWPLLWAATLLLPQNMPEVAKPFAYIILCALHGFLFGTLYAPAQALFFGYNFKMTVTWIIAGLPWDFIHGVSNIFCGMLIYPATKALQQTKKFLK